MLLKSKCQQSIDMLTGLLLIHCRNFRLMPVGLQAINREKLNRATSDALDVFEKKLEEIISSERK